MGSFDPLAVEIMHVALNEAWRTVPEDQRTTELQREMASRLVRAANEGERDPKKLRDAALGLPLSYDFLDNLACLAKQVIAEIDGDASLHEEGRDLVPGSRITPSSLH